MTEERPMTPDEAKAREAFDNKPTTTARLMDAQIEAGFLSRAVDVWVDPRDFESFCESIGRTDVRSVDLRLFRKGMPGDVPVSIGLKDDGQAARAASPDPLDVGHLRSRFMSWLQQGCAPVDAFDKTMNVITERASPDPAPVCKTCGGTRTVRISKPTEWTVTKFCPDCADPAPVEGDEPFGWVDEEAGPFTRDKKVAEHWHKAGRPMVAVFTHPAGMAEDTVQAVLDMADTLELQGETMVTMERVMALVAPLRARRALTGEGNG